MPQDRSLGFLSIWVLLSAIYVLLNAFGGGPGLWLHGSVLVALAVATRMVAKKLAPITPAPLSSPVVMATPSPPHQVPPPVTDGGQLELIRTLARAIDVADPSARGRAYRVSHFCVQIGRHLGLEGADLYDLECAAALHDIGRTAVQYDVLLRPGRLSSNERRELQSHPQLGYEILRALPGLARAAPLVLAHHEQPDGLGYPRGLVGDQVPVGSQIIMVVAAFDSMTSDRPYRQGLTPDAAYAELRACSGTMFFSGVVEALIELHQSRRIFEGFDEQELSLYARGLYASTAVEVYLHESGRFEEELTHGPASGELEIEPPAGLLDQAGGDRPAA